MNTTRRTLFDALAVIVACVGVVSMVHAEEAKRGGVLKIQSFQFPRHFNIAIDAGPGPALPGTQIFGSLLRFNDEWEPVPYFAKKWTIASDGLTYTFHLVENATFHDGKPVTSADVAFSVDVVKNHSPFGVAMFAAVDRVETPDPHTAVFKLSRPHPALLLSLSPMLMPILPKHVYSTGPIRTHPANVKPIGSGPYKLVEFKPNDYFILERYENYFRPGLPYLDQIIGRRVADSTAAEIGFRQGEFHFTSFGGGLGYRNITRLKDVERLVVTQRGYDALGPQTFLEFNLRKAPFDNALVRRAVAYAIDKEFLIQNLLEGLPKRLTGPIPSTFPQYTDQVERYDFDLAKANRLLDEAGLTPKANGIRFATRVDWFPTTALRSVAEYLKPQLRKVGIDVELRPAPDYGTFQKRQASWDFDLTVSVYLGYADPVIGVHRKYLCDNIKQVIWTNTQGYCNPKVDELLKKASVERNSERRRALYVEFQKVVTQDSPLAFLYEQPLFTIHDRDLRNVPKGIWGGLEALDEVWWKDGREPK